MAARRNGGLIAVSPPQARAATLAIGNYRTLLEGGMSPRRTLSEHGETHSGGLERDRRRSSRG
jgi:hypothetical protein